MNHNVPLVILGIAHIACLLILGVLAEDQGPPHYCTILYVGVFFSQTCLLGFWSAVSLLGWPTRVACLFAGGACYSLQFGYSLGIWDLEMLLILLPPAAIVATVMLIVRLFPAKLRPARRIGDPKSSASIQFSVRQLLLLTFALSCTLALGKWLYPYFMWWTNTTYLLTTGACLGLVGLTSAWAVFGRLNALIRTVVGLLVIILLSFFSSFTEFDEPFFWPQVFVVVFTLSALSLAVTLRCGYRLDHRLKLIRVSQ